MPAECDADILVVGGGPAGLGAAQAAAGSGKSVIIVDDNPHIGGQIWRGEFQLPKNRVAQQWMSVHGRVGIRTLTRTRVFMQPKPGVLAAETPTGVLMLSYGRLIIASGARERFLPFPGWTLPNVMGAGGLQALVKGGLPIKGKRVVVAGSGPLLLAVAAFLVGKGAVVLRIAEQASWSKLVRFGARLVGQPGKMFEAIGLKRRLFGVPYSTGCWPVAAHGDTQLRGATLTNGKRRWVEPCEYLACGFGLAPNLEFASLCGCAIENGAMLVNELQESSVAGVYAAGEVTGVGGVDKALIEGQIAGFAAAGDLADARKLLPLRAKLLQFGAILEESFALRDELKTLADGATIVCRCEDVRLAQLHPFNSWRTAKLQTRCGMGPCQGRVCGAALAFLKGWQVESIRPPCMPVRLESLLIEGKD